MEKISKKSIEKLHHFGCVHCEKWWSVGDAPENKEKWWCPWCGKKNNYGGSLKSRITRKTGLK